MDAVLQKDGHSMNRETSKYQAQSYCKGRYQHGEKQHLLMEMQGQVEEINSS